FAALTSSIALTESAVSTFEDELGLSRKPATVLMGVILIGLGSLSAFGFNILDFVHILGMDFLDFFDFLVNSIFLPLGALATCILIVRVIGIRKIEEEVQGSSAFRERGIYRFMIRYLCPLFIVIILVASFLSVFGVISI
ncbi:MAG: sodium-dependent transporter, partial [Eubacterium sp.]|nr:sodium-dependent transporter [Eubacterium sp.]